MLPTDELRRYSRHLALPELGLAGQQALRNAKVLVVGAGGLGSPVSLYLAAAGVGTIGILDHDLVEDSNLQRQVLFTRDDIGQPKAERAASRLRQLNPYIEVCSHIERLDSANALSRIQEYDLVVDGTDNFPTRYLINDACVLANKPLVYGSIFQFDGQASVFHFANGPCYRCLFPEPPPPGMVPSCAEGGVLGVLPALIGSIQATEAIKILTGLGETLSGRLLQYNALTMQFEELHMNRDKQCPICGDQASIHELQDYEAFCGISKSQPNRHSNLISAENLRQRMQETDLLLVDVRETYERQICVIAPSLSIPLGEIEHRLAELEPQKDIVLYCKSGQRAAQAQQRLLQAGFEKVSNLEGGILAWIDHIDPSLTRY